MLKFAQEKKWFPKCVDETTILNAVGYQEWFFSFFSRRLILLRSNTTQQVNVSKFHCQHVGPFLIFLRWVHSVESSKLQELYILGWVLGMLIAEGLSTSASSLSRPIAFKKSSGMTLYFYPCKAAHTPSTTSASRRPRAGVRIFFWDERGALLMCVVVETTPHQSRQSAVVFANWEKRPILAY